MNNAVTVSGLVRYLKARLENDARLQSVMVEGEISNFSAYRSGHWYFSLKDANAQIRCVMFAYQNRRMTWMPKDGDKVIVTGSVSVYEGRGEVQLLVSGMKPAGIGDLYLQFEALKKKLSEEGLFDEEHKKAIPRYPMNVCLITGRNTAARADVLTTMARRWPVAKISEYPALVQGEQSAAQIIHALKTVDPMGFDVILLVRGGGSIEDLWSFNDETLARTIHALRTPVITGVGHEIDYTIADLVSDLRAPTPTGAAERCSPDIKDVLQNLDDLETRMHRSVGMRLEAERENLNALAEKPVLTRPQRLYEQKAVMLESLKQQFLRQMNTKASGMRNEVGGYQNRLVQSGTRIVQEARMRLEGNAQQMNHAMEAYTMKKQEQLKQNAGLLDAYSPLKVLERGYSITTSGKKVIHSVTQVENDMDLSIRVADGIIHAKAQEGSNDHGKGEDI